MGCDCGIRHSVSFARLCKPGVPRALVRTLPSRRKSQPGPSVAQHAAYKVGGCQLGLPCPRCEPRGAARTKQAPETAPAFKGVLKNIGFSFTQRSSARSRGRPSDRTPLSSFSSSLRFGSFACLLKSRNNPTIASSLSGRITAHMDGGDSNVLDDAGSKYRTPGHEIVLLSVDGILFLPRWEIELELHSAASVNKSFRSSGKV